MNRPTCWACHQNLITRLLNNRSGLGDVNYVQLVDFLFPVGFDCPVLMIGNGRLGKWNQWWLLLLLVWHLWRACTVKGRYHEISDSSLSRLKRIKISNDRNGDIIFGEVIRQFYIGTTDSPQFMKLKEKIFRIRKN